MRFDLSGLEKVLAKVAAHSARGETRTASVVRALEGCSIKPFAAIASALLFQSQDYVSALRSNLHELENPEIRSLAESLFPLLVIQKDGRCRLNSVEETLTEFGSVSRWVSQQLMQAKFQCLFLVLFVPLVSIFFALVGGQRWLTNLGTSSGFFVFASAILLYGLGCACLRLAFVRQKRILASRKLSQPAGQASLLRSLWGVSSVPGSSLAALSFALCGENSAPWNALSRQILFAASSSSTPVSQRCGFKPEEHDFLFQFGEGFLRAALPERYRWLVQRHRALSQALKAHASAEAAKLSLYLFGVMAIFFLPALFLMLTLSGINFAPVTLE